MEKINDFFIIKYTNNDKDYIDEIEKYLLNEIENIINFFEIDNYGEKIIINLFDSINKLWELHNDLYNTIEKYGKVPEGVCGFSVKNNIFTLTYSEFIKSKGHENSSLNDLKKLILHELIHCIHAKKNTKTLYKIWLSEGIATTLSHQYDGKEKQFDTTFEDLNNGKCYYSNYNAIFEYILNNYEKEYIMKLINDYQFLENETLKLYNETVIYYKN